LRLTQAQALRVRARDTGVLQLVPVERRAETCGWERMWREWQIQKLKAEIKMPRRSQGHPRDAEATSIRRKWCYRRTICAARTSVVNGTVTVDVTSTAVAPSARADLSVEAPSSWKLRDVLFVGRPGGMAKRQHHQLFKIPPDGSEGLAREREAGAHCSVTTSKWSRDAVGDKVILVRTVAVGQRHRIR